MARPKEEFTKNHRLEIRVSDYELEQIDFIAKHLRVSRSAAVIDAIESRYFEMQEVIAEREKKQKQ